MRRTHPPSFTFLRDQWFKLWVNPSLIQAKPFYNICTSILIFHANIAFTISLQFRKLIFPGFILSRNLVRISQRNSTLSEKWSSGTKVSIISIRNSLTRIKNEVQLFLTLWQVHTNTYKLYLLKNSKAWLCYAKRCHIWSIYFTSEQKILDGKEKIIKSSFLNYSFR